MRILIATFLMLLIGLVAGFGLTAMEFNRIDNRFRGAERKLPGTEKRTDTDRVARAVVAESNEFDFGTLARNETREHTFVIHNEGGQPLSLQRHNISCGRCISTSFTYEGVTPGESVEIPIRYSTKKLADQFSEYVELKTNDPDHPIIRLTIVGTVTKKVHLSKTQFEMIDISASQANEQSLDVYAFQSSTIELVDHDWTNPSTARLFELKAEPIDVSEVDETPKPTAGMRLTLLVKPGLPVGNISQSVQLNVKTTEDVEVEIPIEGTVVSDVSVVGGRNFRSGRNILSLGKVDAAEGTTATLRLLVKGPQRENIDLFVESIEPDNIVKAEVGDHKIISNGAVHMHTLTVEIRAGSPQVNHLGHEQSDMVKVVVGTTHPEAKQVLIYVQFATE